MTAKNKSGQGKPMSDKQFLEAYDRQGAETKKQEQNTVRGLDPDLYREARAQAIRENKTIGEWINEAIRARLESKK